MHKQNLLSRGFRVIADFTLDHPAAAAAAVALILPLAVFAALVVNRPTAWVSALGLSMSLYSCLLAGLAMRAPHGNR